ncbi:MAG TPA: hypothetical protein VNM24_05705 [Burkholderiales bacterium]|jgi:hypothetical protein|nr:hypothetical protein [Burkholderiales bacterium]
MSRATAGCLCPVSGHELPAIGALAREIWYQYYPGIVTVAQIDYMLDRRCRPSVIHSQLAAGQA